MSFFTSGFFWFFEGILFCLALMGLRAWADGRGVPMPFWKWALAAGWMLYCGFTLAFVGTCLGEKEKYAALWGGVFLGVVAIVVGVGFYRLLGFARKREEPAREDA